MFAPFDTDFEIQVCVEKETYVQHLRQPIRICDINMVLCSRKLPVVYSSGQETADHTTMQFCRGFEADGRQPEHL